MCVKSRSRVFVERKAKKYNFNYSKCTCALVTSEGRPSVQVVGWFANQEVGGTLQRHDLW